MTDIIDSIDGSAIHPSGITTELYWQRGPFSLCYMPAEHKSPDRIDRFRSFSTGSATGGDRLNLRSDYRRLRRLGISRFIARMVILRALEIGHRCGTDDHRGAGVPLR